MATSRYFHLTVFCVILAVCFMLAEVIFYDTDTTVLGTVYSTRDNSQSESSLDITLAMQQYMNARLPPRLRNFKNHCWLENYPPKFRYANSFYYKHDCQGREQVVRQYDAMERTRASSHCSDRATDSSCQRLRCFPHFFLVGAPKSGTTDLHATLSLYHPHIVPGARKESQFWVRRRHGITSSHRCPRSKGINATFAEYLDLYDLASTKIRRIKSNKTGQHPAITGDFTPDDMHYLWRWQTMPGNQGQTEPRVTLAHQLYHLAPDTRILVILRDPVQRLISHMYFTSEGRTVSVLASKVEYTLSRFHRCLESHSLRYCAYSDPSALVQGIYSVFVQDWLSVFPEEQLMIIRFEEYRENRQKVLQGIVKFLGLDPALSRKNSSVVGRGVTLKTQNKGSMPNSTLRLLRDFYRPYNRELVRILHDNTFNWTYV